MAPFTAPNVLTPSMHVVFLLTCPQWNDHLRHQTKEEKGEEDEEEKRKSRVGWSHHSQRQDDKEVLEWSGG